MKRILMGILAVATIFSAYAVPTNEELLEWDAGPGPIKYDANGYISSVIIIGMASVNDALLAGNPSIARKQGNKDAARDARIQLAQFLSTQVVWGSDDGGKTVLADASATAKDENGKKVTVNSSFKREKITEEKTKERAQACLSGLHRIHSGFNKSGNYVWIGVWETSYLEDIERRSKQMNRNNAEVFDLGKSAAKTKEIEDAKEREAIQNGKNNGNNGNNGNSRDGEMTRHPNFRLVVPTTATPDANKYF